MQAGSALEGMVVCGCRRVCAILGVYFRCGTAPKGQSASVDTRFMPQWGSHGQQPNLCRHCSFRGRALTFFPHSHGNWAIVRSDRKGDGEPWTGGGQRGVVGNFRSSILHNRTVFRLPPLSFYLPLVPALSTHSFFFSSNFRRWGNAIRKRGQAATIGVRARLNDPLVGGFIMLTGC